MRGASKMAVLIAATMASGLICFHLGHRAGVKDGIKKADKFIMAFIEFSNQFDAMMKEINEVLKDEIERLKGEENASTEQFSK